MVGATVSYAQVPTQGTSQKWDEQGPRGLQLAGAVGPGGAARPSSGFPGLMSEDGL